MNVQPAHGDSELGGEAGAEENPLRPDPQSAEFCCNQNGSSVGNTIDRGMTKAVAFRL